MKKFLNYNLALSKDKGFITLEILIAILIASAFLAVAMQSLVYAMAIKVQAQEKQRASQLITDDLEIANNLANSSGLGGKCDATSSEYNLGFAKKLWEKLIDPTEGNGEFPTINLLADGTGRELALERTEVSLTDSDAPHRTLKIKYQVWWGRNAAGKFLDKNGTERITSDEPIAETYVEIIPDAALSCP